MIFAIDKRRENIKNNEVRYLLRNQIITKSFEYTINEAIMN